MYYLFAFAKDLNSIKVKKKKNFLYFKTIAINHLSNTTFINHLIKLNSSFVCVYFEANYVYLKNNLVSTEPLNH